MSQASRTITIAAIGLAGSVLLLLVLSAYVLRGVLRPIRIVAEQEVPVPVSVNRVGQDEPLDAPVTAGFVDLALARLDGVDLCLQRIVPGQLLFRERLREVPQVIAEVQEDIVLCRGDFAPDFGP